MARSRGVAGAPVRPLAARALRRRSDPKSLGFQSTEDLESFNGLIGQDRALNAVRFGTSIGHRGFNLYALGPEGSGRHTAIRTILEAKAAEVATPDDWVYVNNFETPHRPRAIRLPPGSAARLRDAMAALIDDLATAIPTLFQSEDYRIRRRALDEEFEGANEDAFDDLKQKAEAESIAILRTPMGFALAPVQNGEVVKPEAFNALPAEQREAIQKTIEVLQKDLEQVLQQLPALEKDRRDKLRKLNAEMAGITVGLAIQDVNRQFNEIEAVGTYLEEVKKDLIENAQIFLQGTEGEEQAQFPTGAARFLVDPRFRRYSVNVIVDHCDHDPGAPIVREEYPTLANIVGRVEHISQMGALVTDFTLIKPGALHRANGGYLILDARRILTQPFAWEALKRCLRSNCVTITSAADQMGSAMTTSLEPDPIPLDAKVVLIGDRQLYYLLVNREPEFVELFKVQVDFEEQVERTDESVQEFARLIGTIAKKENLKALTAAGVARVIDEASRMADDAERISLRVGPLADLLKEANFWAGEARRRRITDKDIGRAVAERHHRSDRIREASLESIAREIVLIDTDGESVGQINGLSVLSIGDFRFGRPTRITARARMGTGQVVDIEREVELGGPLHSKGVLILSSYLSSRFALDEPMSLWASLVFEQSYGGVDGDSASSTELYALLSVLADTPIRQDLAVTGSVNQLGEVQAIGGVNEKIEGFYDVCAERGLTGNQGVLVPVANVQHLMLREDIVKAAASRQFHVYPIETIDQGITLLTGIAAGERDASGVYPDGTINARVESKLRAFAEARRAFAARDGADRSGEE